MIVPLGGERMERSHEINCLNLGFARFQACGLAENGLDFIDHTKY